MPTPEALKSQIENVEDLQSVVKTMKALAAVSIRQYERAVASLQTYTRTVELGLQILLKHRHFSEQTQPLPAIVGTRPNPEAGLGAIIFGSDQGLCGQFNEQIVNHAIAHLDELQIPPGDRIMMAVGGRLMPALTNAKQAIEKQFPVPTSATAITTRVEDLLFELEEWRSQQKVKQVMLFYNHPTSSASFRSEHLQILPIDLDWLCSLEERPWETSMFPSFTMHWDRLFSALIRQYLFVSLYRAFAESLASENASRLASMQAAEKNIDETLSDLSGQYRRQRQSSITAELLDIVSGFEALTQQ